MSVSNQRLLSKVMPTLLEHEGVWVGTYQHVNLNGEIIDQHRSRVECQFPETGADVYVQKNRFEWPDGRVATAGFGGVLEGDRLFWDTETFRGYGWEAGPGIFMLDLERKDVLGATFKEVIIMDSGLQTRARTWHWFKDGECYQRTLCNERREA